MQEARGKIISWKFSTQLEQKPFRKFSISAGKFFSVCVLFLLPFQLLACCCCILIREMPLGQLDVDEFGMFAIRKYNHFFFFPLWKEAGNEWMNEWMTFAAVVVLCAILFPKKNEFLPCGNCRGWNISLDPESECEYQMQSMNIFLLLSVRSEKVSKYPKAFRLSVLLCFSFSWKIVLKDFPHLGALLKVEKRSARKAQNERDEVF